MPIHQYKCGKCKKHYEVFYTSMSAVDREERNEKCPECGSRSKKRSVVNKMSFILKGKGWARDGY